ncbi:hypothetical protein M9H77_14766 [Catharanthus roseus]|uniref:Uncharacterized protein n=1 Tax=Catharanthus roseus TaxID=4058 RepID=A0ACC0BP81_CATRO|nr:hypothetical protein M9H77_14766 [Catharanthus roseus]
MASSALLMDSARKLFDEMAVKDELSWTTIIAGFVRNNNLDAAREVFNKMDEKLVVAWNAMISGYVHKGFISKALEMFRMMSLQGIKQDEFTYSSVLSACGEAGLFHFGKQLHAYILRTEAITGGQFLVSVSNALITLYGKCGKVDQARKIFGQITVKDLVSWNAVLSAYVNARRINEAKHFFEKMPEKIHWHGQ